jgi:hypothetical protein
MATVKYYPTLPSDMIYLPDEGTLLDHDETSAEFKARTVNDTRLFTGQDFVYEDNTLVGGTVTEISYKTSGGTYYTVTGLNWDVSDENYTLFGGDDRFIGSRANDNLSAEAGNDRIRAGKGEDYIRGGTGDDILKGGLDGDHFVFFAGDGDDWIMDFDAIGPDRDVIHLRDVERFSELTISKVGHDTVIEYGDDSITLRDVLPTDLSARNFDLG